jgi:hypothetical protein
MAKSLFRAIAAIALAAFAPTTAQAVTVYSSYDFDFSDSYVVGALDTTTVGNSVVFRSKTDPLLKVKATAWSIDKNDAGTGDDVVTAATLKLWSGGLGVKNKNEADTSPQHSIDNGVGSSEGSPNNMVDFVMLQFDYDVDINGLTTGWVSEDQDASLRVGKGNPFNWNASLGLDGKKVFGSTGSVELSDYVNMASSSLDSRIDTSAAGTPGSRTVNSGNQHGMMWLIGALYGSDNHDYFKLDMLNVTVFPTVPEPSTWMTMILGFGFIGSMMRRRKAPFGKGAALAA